MSKLFCYDEAALITYLGDEVQHVLFLDDLQADLNVLFVVDKVLGHFEIVPVL